jgi:5-methylcytosine-specific restriction protein A
VKFSNVARKEGMRKSNKTNSLVIVSNHIKSIYNDRWIEKNFHYTGMGQSGDQSIDFMQNKTLAESNINQVSVHLFEVFKDLVYTYIGSVKLSNKPYSETQPDKNWLDRIVFVFPLKLTSDEKSLLQKREIDNLQHVKGKKAIRLSDDELKKRALKSIKKAGNRTVSTTQHDRSPWIFEYIKRKVNGVCQLCIQNAPFLNQKSVPLKRTLHQKYHQVKNHHNIVNIPTFL